MRHGSSPAGLASFTGGGLDRKKGGMLDTSSSASRQHYIDTGRYLTFAQVAEQQAREAQDAT